MKEEGGEEEEEKGGQPHAGAFSSHKHARTYTRMVAASSSSNSKPFSTLVQEIKTSPSARSSY